MYSQNFQREVPISKPMMRGVLHQAAFYCFLGAGFMLVSMARTPIGRGAALIYVISMSLLFGISALYHLPNWSHKVRRRLRRLDHSSIYIMIAGSATPIVLLSMSHANGRIILWTFWGAASLGVAKSLLWPMAPRFLNVSLYVATGLLAAPWMGELKLGLGELGLALIITSGVVYVVGALVYALRKPNPFPNVFGYHEVFHALVVVASSIHFKLVYDLILKN